MNLRGYAGLIAMVVVDGTAAARPSEVSDPSLVGVWRVVKFCRDGPTGRFDSYLGYYGTYTITSDSTVVHDVVGGTIPSYTGTDQARVYRIRGDTLTIGGNRVTWPCRVLLRVR